MMLFPCDPGAVIYQKRRNGHGKRKVIRQISIKSKLHDLQLAQKVKESICNEPFYRPSLAKLVSVAKLALE